MNTRPNSSGNWWQRLLALEKSEFVSLGLSFLYFFSVLCSYYLLRPIREAMGVLNGPENIRWLYLAVFLIMLAVVPLFGWLTSRFPRKKFLPWVYLFFVFCLVGFYFSFGGENSESIYVARVFFVWVSIFNLSAVSVFWSFMADLYKKEQARRLFGLISAGGSAGALCGPAITAILVDIIDFRNLFLLSAGFLLVAMICIYKLSQMMGHRNSDEHESRADRPVGGSIWDGIKLVATSPYLIGIASMMIIGSFVATALYIFQAEYFQANFPDSNTRTRVFAWMDFTTNVTALLLQSLVAHHAIKKLGAGWCLALLPIVSVVGFIVLAIHPILAVIVVGQVVRRAITFGINGPAKELLFTILTPAEKYKAKNFIETALWRGGDAISSQTVSMLQTVGATISTVAAICALMAAVWVAIALKTGGRYQNQYAKLKTSKATKGRDNVSAKQSN